MDKQFSIEQIDLIKAAFKKVAPNFDDVPTADKVIAELTKPLVEFKPNEVVYVIKDKRYGKVRDAEVCNAFLQTGARKLSATEAGAEGLILALEQIKHAQTPQRGREIAAEALTQWKQERNE